MNALDSATARDIAANNALASFTLQLGDRTFAVSSPERGNASHEEAPTRAATALVSFGVSSTDGALLTGQLGQVAQLRDMLGRSLGAYRLRSVDALLNVVVAQACG